MWRDRHGVGFSSPPKPVELELSGLKGVTFPSLGLAGTSILLAGTGGLLPGHCRHHRARALQELPMGARQRSGNQPSNVKLLNFPGQETV